MTDHVGEAASPDSLAACALPRRHVVAVALGNALEFHDFITYAFFAAPLLGLSMLAAATTTNYVLDYMTTYANATLGMPERLALGAKVMVGLCGLVCDPLSGWLSDRIGRKPVMVVPWVVLLLVIFRRSGCWGASAPAPRSLALRRYWRSPRRCRPAPCWRR